MNNGNGDTNGSRKWVKYGAIAGFGGALVLGVATSLIIAGNMTNQVRVNSDRLTNLEGGAAACVRIQAHNDLQAQVNRVEERENTNDKGFFQDLGAVKTRVEDLSFQIHELDARIDRIRK